LPLAQLKSDEEDFQLSSGCAPSPGTNTMLQNQYKALFIFKLSGDLQDAHSVSVLLDSSSGYSTLIPCFTTS
jgi:hypothetical protein